MKKHLLTAITALILFISFGVISVESGESPKNEVVSSYTEEMPSVCYGAVTRTFEISTTTSPPIQIEFAGLTGEDLNATYISDIDVLGDQMRQGLVNRDQSIVLYYNGHLNINDVSNGILISALEETGKGYEGDYLRWVIGGAKKVGNYDSRYGYKLTYTFDYYTTASQEQELTKKVASVIKSFGFNSSTTQYEKIKKIYDYICKNVDYDNEHINDGKMYPLQFTAYAAMVQGKAVCQGYAALFYRMAMDSGLSVRLIPGYSIIGGVSSNHAWNIVKIGSVYYNVDPTWDAKWYKYNTYKYFLLPGVNYLDHVRGGKYSDLYDEYTSDNFKKLYPMATSTYVPQTSHVHKDSSGKEPTSCVPGNITYVCSICGKKITEYQSGNGNHQFVITGGTTLHDCESGYVEYTCSYCGTKKKEYHTGNGNHKFVITGGTALHDCESGYVEYTCSYCGTKKKEYHTGNGNHKFVITGGTALHDCESGYVEYTCSYCGTKKKEYKSATGSHNWKQTTSTSAVHACQDSSVSYACTKCSKTKTEINKATSTHQYKKVSSVTLSASKKGSVTYKCSICNETYKKYTTYDVGKTFTVGKVKYKITAKDSTVKVTKGSSKTATYVSIPDNVSYGGVKYNVTSIASSAFSGYTKLKIVIIGANVSSIGTKAFYKCTKLTNVTIKKAVKTIGAKAFYGDAKLKKLTIETTNIVLSGLGDNAFKGTYSKMKVNVPSPKVASYKMLLKIKGASRSIVVVAD